MAGCFITFEGIEGCGKSTQIRLLESAFKAKGYAPVLTREPGGTAIGEKIRQLLLSVEHKEMLPLTELLLYNAARCQHVGEVIRPALAAEKIVLCDRYADASTAYQGAARAIDTKVLKKLFELATGNLKPDLTFLLDCPVEVGMKRIRKKKLDRFEKEEAAFHERVRSGYLKIAEEEPQRVKVIDAAKEMQTVHQHIVREALRAAQKK